MRVERFDAYEPAAAWAEEQGKTAKAVYVVMNPFDPAAIKAKAVDDSAITRRRWLLVDVDPQRPVDTSSSREELELAVGTCKVIQGFLTEFGWPEPVRCLSGNGAHLLYRIDLPNDGESALLVNRVLRFLAAECDIEGKISVDPTVGNASRITKLYGTRVRKGENIQERPHRLSRITHVPERLDPVPLEALALVAAKAPAPQEPRQSTSPGAAYDLGQVLNRVVQLLPAKEKDGATLYTIRCPWSGEHSENPEKDPAAVIIVQADGALAYKCLHSHCSSRTWVDLRDRLGINTKAWQEKREKEEKPKNGRPKEEPKAPTRVIVADRARRDQVIQRMNTYAARGAMPDSLPTGMGHLDAMLLGGFRPSKLYVLGGETSRGKTTLLMQWAFHIARSVRLVGIVTPEMDLESLDERAYAQLSGCPISQYRKWPQQTAASWIEAVAPQNVKASFDPHDIIPFAEEEKPNLFIVDYAQQAVDYEAKQRSTALGQLGADCLWIAKRLKIPVVLGTQVNVTAERDFNVRETRILEHQADALLYLDIQYEKNFGKDGERILKPGQSLRIEKNRHGAAGRIEIIWEPEKFLFREA